MESSSVVALALLHNLVAAERRWNAPWRHAAVSWSLLPLRSGRGTFTGWTRGRPPRIVAVPDRRAPEATPSGTHWRLVKFGAAEWK